MWWNRNQIVIEKKKFVQSENIYGKYFYASEGEIRWEIMRVDRVLSSKQGGVVAYAYTKENARGLVDFFDKTVERRLKNEQTS